MKYTITNGTLWVGYKYLINEDICSKNTVMSFQRSHSSVVKKFGDNSFINYDTIPAPTRKKLPPKEELIKEYYQQEHDRWTNTYYRKLETAYNENFARYREIYKARNIRPDQVNEYARHHAVWVEIVNIHSDKSQGKILRNLWEAYNRLYPGRYCYDRMNACINKCRREGPENLLIKRFKGSEKKFNDVYDYWIIECLRSGKKYSRAHIHRKIVELSEEKGKPAPGLTTVKNRIEKLLPLIRADRYGSDHDTNKLPYASISKASASDLCWQIDGWQLPFYMKDYKRVTLMGVIDAHSGKIVGYDLAPTENTESILRSLENAIKDTGVLPCEIVSDNHAFNKTNEAEYFKQTLDTHFGTTWTVSSNPRYKSIVERTFHTLGEQHFKEMPGYIGEGIRTKNPDGRTSQELMDKYTRSGGWLTADQIKLMAVKCIDDYNKAIQKDGKSRNKRYEDNRSDRASKVSLQERMQLFIRAREYKISRAQINITREGIKHEFQLSADLYDKWDEKTVLVRYVDFTEIHIYEKETDTYIGCVKRKQVIHGAKADQTEEDTQKFFKNKGRIAGIKARRKKKLNEIGESAYSTDPDAAYSINPKLSSKIVIESLLSDGEIARQLQRQGVEANRIPEFPNVKEVNTYNPAFANTKKAKRRESPFAATEKEAIEFDLEKYITDDE